MKTRIRELTLEEKQSAGECEHFRRLITEIYPSGIISIVSDTWDLWKVCTKYLTELKEIILARDGKVVIRPDSGDPVDIICGLNIPKFKDFIVAENYFRRNIDGNIKFIVDSVYYKIILHGGSDFKYENYNATPVDKGVIELLWDVFGGTIIKGSDSKDYKLLDNHIGAIYGDSITRERATEICQRLKDKGFASQVVFGIGSFTYQYNTRDTFGIAMKATYIEIGEESREIFKNPITDDGTKKSATGLLCVKKEKGEYTLIDKVNWEQEKQSELKTVFKNGKLIKDFTLQEVRENAKTS